FAVRFCYSDDAGFSNCVVSLAKVKEFDDRPLLVCLLKPSGVQTFLANSTFIKKVSQTSQKLTISRIRGTFLGHDILRRYQEIENLPTNFEALYEIHTQFSWDENLARIVEATTAISPTGIRFAPTPQQIENILKAPATSVSAEQNGELDRVEAALLKNLSSKASEVLAAAEIDNVNLRGNRIEQLLSGGANFHKIEDQTFEAPGRIRILVDLKTKMLHLASSPKLYNIDKTLEALADGRTVFCLFFIGVDAKNRTEHGRLIDILDTQLLNLTRIQFHWAGRNSRGVTQMTGSAKDFFAPSFQRRVDPAKASSLLTKFLAS
ncbi:MAG TPA: hypothetical protein VFC17_14115, partial [Candidatus Limnocylindrales bacterium]|nr:hypothetical protein [Candidatus Limnocylindrales bacterium]